MQSVMTAMQVSIEVSILAMRIIVEQLCRCTIVIQMINRIIELMLDDKYDSNEDRRRGEEGKCLLFRL